MLEGCNDQELSRFNGTALEVPIPMSLEQGTYEDAL